MDEDQRVSVIFSEEGVLGISLKKNYAKSGGFTNEKNGTIEIGKIAKGTQAENHVELCSGLILVSVEDDAVPSVNSRSKSDIESFNRELDAFESRIRGVLGTVRPLKMEFRPAVEYGLIDWYFQGWSDWFKGRVSRSEYFFKSIAISLFMVIFSAGPGEGQEGFFILVGIPVFLVLVFYYWAIIVRRFHDLGYPGWLLLPLLLIVALVPEFRTILTLFSGFILLFIKGTDGPNKYGPDPLNTTDISIDTEEE